MKNENLYKFIKEFNKSEAFTTNDIMEGLKSLPEEDHELFMMLVNYINGRDFKNKLSKGDKE